MSTQEAKHLVKGDRLRFTNGAEVIVDEVISECVVRFDTGDYRDHINVEDMGNVVKVTDGSE